mmetsp:Transcript_17271/g.19689  ORF Transcript_17271/g.19689 Transcript_17271/m.19689 type:complete len:229 (-) Transcript_17271:971-1657(-)
MFSAILARIFAVFEVYVVHYRLLVCIAPAAAGIIWVSPSTCPFEATVPRGFAERCVVEPMGFSCHHVVALLCKDSPRVTSKDSTRVDSEVQVKRNCERNFRGEGGDVSHTLRFVFRVQPVTRRRMYKALNSHDRLHQSSRKGVVIVVQRAIDCLKCTSNDKRRSKWKTRWNSLLTELLWQWRKKPRCTRCTVVARRARAAFTVRRHALFHHDIFLKNPSRFGVAVTST